MDEKVKEPECEQGVITMEKPYDIGDGVISFRGVDLLTYGWGVSANSVVVIRNALNQAFQKGFSEGATVTIKAIKIVKEISANLDKETVNEGTTGEEDKRSQSTDKGD